MIIVTGAAGFIGRNVIADLNEAGHRDILAVDQLGQDERWRNLQGLSFLDYMEKDYFIQAITQEQFDNVKAIIHLGACSDTRESNATYLIRNNYEYSKILARYAVAHDVRFIYASSAATYGDGALGYNDEEEDIEKLKPLNMYGYSKQLMDLWVKNSQLFDRVVALKYFNVYGPYEDHKGDMRSVVCKAYHQIQKEGKISLFKSYREEYLDGEQERDFLYVKDAVRMTTYFLDHPELNGVFNIGSGVTHTWNDLARALFKALDQEVNIEYIDMPEDIRKHYQYHTKANVQKIVQSGYVYPPLSLEKGVEAYVRDYLQIFE